MKKYFLFLLLAPLFVGFTSAYNCSTLASRMSDFVERYDDFTYRYKIFAARGERVSNEYEASLWMQEYYKMEAQSDSFAAEKDVLFEENDRCDSQRSKISQYLQAWDSAFKDLQNASSYKDFNIKTINKAIDNYQKAYDIMKGGSWLGDTSIESQLKERISKLKEFKSLVEITDEVINLSDKADNYFNKWDYDKALKYYKEALTYRSKIDDESMFISIELKITNINSIKAQEKQQEEAKKQAEEKAELDSFNEAKVYLWYKTSIIDGIIESLREADKSTQNRILNLVTKFKESKDPYTRNIGIYLLHERNK